MSPAEHRKASERFANALAALQQEGRARGSDIEPLGDLSRDDARVLARVWPSLPERVRVAVVRQMGDLTDDRVDLDFGRALRVALGDPSAAVRQLAIAALWEDDSSDLLDILLDLVVGDPSLDVRIEAARGLGPFADRAALGLLPQSTEERLRSTLLRLAEEDVTPYLLRRRALESLGAVAQDSETMALLHELFDLDDHGLRASAVFAMGKSEKSDWVPVVVPELGNADPEVCFEAVRACGLLGDERAVPNLIEHIGDDDAQIRMAAIASLGQIGGRDAIAALRRLREESDEPEADVVEAALQEALGGNVIPAGL